MPSLDSAQFIREVRKAKTFPPVIVIAGEEETILEDCLKAFQSAFENLYGNSFPEFNQETLQAGRDNIEKVLDSCATLPFGSSKKWVVLRRFEKAPESFKKTLAEECSRFGDSAVLVLLWAERPSRDLMGHVLMLAAERIGTVVKCWRPFEDQRPQWIIQQMAIEGKRMSLQAAQLLSEEGGESLAELKSEIEKLVLFSGAKEQIDLADVRHTMSFKRNRSIWDMTEALEKGQGKRAAAILEECLEQGEEPLAALNLIARSLRRSPAAARSLKKSYALFRQMKTTDRMLKSGQGVEAALFEEFFALI